MEATQKKETRRRIGTIYFNLKMIIWGENCVSKKIVECKKIQQTYNFWWRH